MRNWRWTNPLSLFVVSLVTIQSSVVDLRKWSNTRITLHSMQMYRTSQPNANIYMISGFSFLAAICTIKMFWLFTLRCYLWRRIYDVAKIIHWVTFSDGVIDGWMQWWKGQANNRPPICAYMVQCNVSRAALTGEGRFPAPSQPHLMWIIAPYYSGSFVSVPVNGMGRFTQDLMRYPDHIVVWILRKLSSCAFRQWQR